MQFQAFGVKWEMWPQYLIKKLFKIYIFCLFSILTNFLKHQEQLILLGGCGWPLKGPFLLLWSTFIHQVQYQV